MLERFFERGKSNDKKLIQRDLEDAGIKNSGEWREALDLETPLGAEESFEHHLSEQNKHETEKNISGQIEDKNWQNQVNVAFQQEDYSFIKMLQKVRPNFSPDSELVKSKLNKLVTSRQSNWETTYRAIKEISKTRPDDAVIEVELSKLIEKFSEVNDTLSDLESLIRTTGIKPSIEQVQAMYRNCLQDTRIYLSRLDDIFERVRHVTEIKPNISLIEEILESGNILRAKELASLFNFEITSEIIQRTFENIFQKKGELDIYQIRRIKEQPTPELVQRAYEKITEEHKSHWIDSIKSLEEATGIKPVFSEEKLRPVFEEFLKNGLYDRVGYLGVEHVIELTGIRPPVDLVEKEALRLIDHGQTIKDSLKRFSKIVEVEFEISESDIQERYQKAITDGQAFIILNLYGAFAIKPAINKETARQFMLLYISDTYHNPISGLEKVFGFKFKVTNEEAQAEYDKKIQRMIYSRDANGDYFNKIKETTGMGCNKKKLTLGFVMFLENSLLQQEKTKAPPELGEKWIDTTKNLVEKLKITIPSESVLQIYKKLIEYDTIYSNSLSLLYKITETALPPEMAQKAYRKVLSSSDKQVGQVDALAVIFEISGIKANVPEALAQQFYLSRIELNLWSVREEIKRVAEITGINPIFDPEDIGRLYKQLILNGEEKKLGNIKKITGIDLQLDQETVAYVSRQIEAVIEKVHFRDYEKEKKFSINNLLPYLQKVDTLMVATRIKPDTDKLQAVYVDIFANDPYWDTKIEKLVEVTGLKPVFYPEQIQIKGQELLEKGELRSFERLQKYGRFVFTEEIITKTYDTLLATNQHYDAYDRRYYYNQDWIDRIKGFKEMTGIFPNEVQAAQIFSHIAQDSRAVQAGSNDLIEKTIKFFVENFQMTITSGIAKHVAISFLARGNVSNMKKFIEKVGVTLEFTDKDLLPCVDNLLETKDIDSLAYLKQDLKMDRVHATEEVVQRAYQHFVSQEGFEKTSSKSLRSFKDIFRLTGTPAHLSVEQVDQIYKTVDFSEWKTIKDITGTAPTSEVVQYRYLQCYLGNRYGFEKDIKTLQEITGEAISEAVVREVIEKYIPEAKTKEILEIIKISGIKPKINTEIAQLGYRKVVENYRNGGGGNRPLFEEKMVKLFDLLKSDLGVLPDKDSLTEIFLATLGQKDYFHSYVDHNGEKIYPQFWVYLVKEFGKPDPEVVQRIYLAQLGA